MIMVMATLTLTLTLTLCYSARGGELWLMRARGGMGGGEGLQMLAGDTSSESYVNVVRISPEGGYVAVGHEDGCLRVYKPVAEGKGIQMRVLWTFRHGGAVEHIDFSADESMVQASDATGHLRRPKPKPEPESKANLELSLEPKTMPGSDLALV